MSGEKKKDGPSKKELKKMAKKAAKENKETIPDQPAVDAAALTLHNAAMDGSTLKVVWASLIFDKPLKYVSSHYNNSKVVHGPYLQLSNLQVSGGNSMAKALSASNSDLMVDEWCEWERTCLRKSPAKALAKLEQGLSHGSPCHLVGHAMTVADICVLTTLYTANSLDMSPLIQTFCDTHKASFDKAKQELAKNAPFEIDITNPSLLGVLEQAFRLAMEREFGKDILDIFEKNTVSKTQSAKMGDFQCNASMPIFAHLKREGKLGTLTSPQQVALQLVQSLNGKQSVVQELKVQGAGFIVGRVSPLYLQDLVNTFLHSGGILPKPSIAPQVCVVDFSSPNIAKEMHVGHLRSTIIGESVCRILEFVGHDVKRVNHVGDWGTQFGMLIQYLREEYPNFHTSKPNITDLTGFYKSAKMKFDESPEFKKQSQLNVVQLQSGNAECMEIWNLLCQISRSEFEKVYKRLDITVEECGESFYNDKIPPVIEEFSNARLISIEEGGAKCVFVDDNHNNVPLMLQKSDGGFGYDSTDMAALKYRLQDLQAKHLVYITDFSQGDHFALCFQAAQQIGWLEEGQKLQHIGFGTVQGEDGKRFKTRSGDTVRLVDLLDEAVSRMEASLKDRIAEEKANITLDQVHEVAEAIGYGAVKYFDLRRNPTSNYKFSYNQMLDTKGNTAVYLLYAYARLSSICAKAAAEHGVNVDDLLAQKTPVQVQHQSERNLVLQLQCFVDTILVTLGDMYPYHICEYLYNLAICASDFVTQCRVLGSPEMNSRLLLCKATTLVMKQCFDLLAIRHVEKI